ERDGRLVPGRQLRAADIDGALGQRNHPDWKTLAIDGITGEIVAPNGSIGFRWTDTGGVKPEKTPGVAETGTSGGEEMETGRWNLEERAQGRDVRLKMTLILDGDHDTVAAVDFPWFGGKAANGFENDPRGDVLTRNVPARRIR